MKNLNNNTSNYGVIDEKDITFVKQYICRVCLELNKQDLISILNFLKKEHVENNIFNQNNDGIKINLDILDNELIFKLYEYVKFKSSNNSNY
jgi:hypothetical protein